MDGFALWPFIGRFGGARREAAAFFSIKRMNEIFWKCFQLGRVFQLPPLSEENEITFSRRRHNYTIGGINDGACELCAAFSHCSFPLSSLMAIKCYSLEKEKKQGKYFDNDLQGKSHRGDLWGSSPLSHVMWFPLMEDRFPESDRVLPGGLEWISPPGGT